jgi:cell volume regulation protein A
VSDGQLILAAAALLAGGIAASLLAVRMRVPGLLLFLALGMLIGSDGTGWIDFGADPSDYELTRTIGVVALALILFEGGLTAGYEEIRPVLRPALLLALVGTLATAVIAGFAAVALFELSTLEGLLLGSIVAATDGAATFALLRGSTLRRRLARTLEGEAGLNDPVAVLLVLGFIEWIEHPDYGLDDMLVLFGQQLSIGLVAGGLVGWLAVRALQRVRLDAGLYPVASLATAGLSYGAADSLEGSGFLAAYLAGLVLGSAAIPAKRTMTVFHQGLASIAQIAMFLVLGLIVFPSQLDDFWVEGTALALVLVFVARPVATAIATAFDRFSATERLVLGWAGLRGAVPVVLATFPVIADVPKNSLDFFNIVFFAVVISTVLQGPTFEPLARALGVTTDEPALPRPLAETGTIRRLGAEIVEYPVAHSDAIVGARVRDLGLPRDALLSVIVRGREAVLPRGSTRIEAGDRLHVVVRQEVADAVPRLLERWRAGPAQRADAARRPLRASTAVFTTRPWGDEDGDPAYPRRVMDLAVVDHLRTRRDRRGALVVLEDGRFAITGPILALGGATQLQRHARRRLVEEGDDAARAWWQEVIGALAR